MYYKMDELPYKVLCSCSQAAMSRTFSWLMGAMHLKDEWRCVWVDGGAQCAVSLNTCGAPERLKLCADKVEN